MSIAISDEQKAIHLVFERLHQVGAHWQLNRVRKVPDAAITTAFGRFDPIKLGDLKAFEYAGSKARFGTQQVIFLEPPSKENGAIAALWCRWDYSSDKPKCGFYYGLWTLEPSFPRAEGDDSKHPAFVGYRFETPEGGDKHNYFHSQPCRSMGEKDDEIENALPISNRDPTWPLAASNSVDLLLCFLVSIYGHARFNKVRLELLQEPQGRGNPELLASLMRIKALAN